MVGRRCEYCRGIFPFEIVGNYVYCPWVLCKAGFIPRRIEGTEFNAKYLRLAEKQALEEQGRELALLCR